jgi:hypothetical protein
MKNWFEVDRRGLARLLERKGKELVLYELLQNVWDEPGVTKVSVSLKVQGRNRAALAVEDDAPEQRGRFNLGEKLVLAITRVGTGPGGADNKST